MPTVKFLEEAEHFFHSGKCNSAMHLLASGFASVRKEISNADWKQFVCDARQHNAVKTTRLCPFINHAVSRPFGYPGDATLIDHIYGYAKPVLTGLPRSLYACMTGASAPRSVRFRRHVLAHYIDKVLHEREGDSSVLSLGCGHLRELDLSRVLTQVRPHRFLALDQDANSLAEVERCFATLGITAERRNIKDIVAGRLNYEGLDLIYAAGLYDYLMPEAAHSLTLRLFNMLAPGGTLFIANFLSNIPDAGFMEAAMDWWLIYRDENEMRALLSGIEESDIASMQQYRDPDNNITFLEVHRT
ncbi:hypothetical protein AWB78_05939 [Caballeronia calidae]|uniref:Methyltransferase domain protein n=1 Tax=Caballeronia calidae TaxID=1777139 RepID=A0A158E0I4_9BURK|nr:class I SAM-dependent methyltransferase [Caballeronia calidae]SAL00362.1 hypothetical protein AWB78_05939 [Caballeronia calidae]